MDTRDDPPTLPAIPLRVRQRHRRRERKPFAPVRWQGRKPDPPPAGSIDVELPASDPEPDEDERDTLPELRPEDDGSEAFFADGDSLAPTEDGDRETLPELPPRRRLTPLVALAVLLSSFLCVAALLRSSEPTARAASRPPVPVPEPEPEPDLPLPLHPPPASPPDPSTLRESARAHLEARRIDLALEASKRAVDADPEDATGWLLLGAAQMEARQHAQASVSFRTCARVARTGPVGECRALLR